MVSQSKDNDHTAGPKLVVDSSKDPYGDADVTNQNGFVDAVDSARLTSFWEPTPSAKAQN